MGNEYVLYKYVPKKGVCKILTVRHRTSAILTTSTTYDEDNNNNNNVRLFYAYNCYYYIKYKNQNPFRSNIMYTTCENEQEKVKLYLPILFMALTLIFSFNTKYKRTHTFVRSDILVFEFFSYISFQFSLQNSCSLLFIPIYVSSKISIARCSSVFGTYTTHTAEHTIHIIFICSRILSSVRATCIHIKLYINFMFN